MQYLQQFNDRDTTELFLWLQKNKCKENNDEVEHIIDYFMGIDNPNYNLSYKEAKKKSKDWIRSMSVDTTNEVEGVDYEVVYSFDDGMKFVKLLSEVAYNNESANMRHCIKTYRGKDNIVYSLRDNKNLPHATMDILRDGDNKIQQIQGKGNNTIEGKYQEYNIKFLQFMGFEISKRFMKKLGYFYGGDFLNKYNFGKYKYGEIKEEDLLEEYKGITYIGNFKGTIKQWIKLGKKHCLGNFYCYNNNLTSLQGGPIIVSDDFYCYNNKLTSLIGGPTTVGGDFFCNNNNLTGLEGCPTTVGGIFNCSNNKIISLVGGPINVGGGFYCSHNKLTSLQGGPINVGGGFYCSNNKLKSLVGCPTTVSYDFYCYNNKLTSLIGGPINVGGGFDCSNNNLTGLEGCPTTVGGIFNCSNNKIISLE